MDAVVSERRGERESDLALFIPNFIALIDGHPPVTLPTRGRVAAQQGGFHTDRPPLHRLPRRQDRIQGQAHEAASRPQFVRQIDHLTPRVVVSGRKRIGPGHIPLTHTDVPVPSAPAERRRPIKTGDGGVGKVLGGDGHRKRLIGILRGGNRAPGEVIDHAAQSVIIKNRSDRAVPGQRGIDRFREDEEQGFVRLDGAVAEDGDFEAAVRHSRGKKQGPAGPLVVAACLSRVVARRIGDKHDLTARRREADVELKLGGPLVSLGHHRIVDVAHHRRVVIQNRDGRLGAGQEGVRRTAQADNEGLVGLVQGIAHDRHGKLLIRRPRRKGQPALAGRKIYKVGRGFWRGRECD